MNSQKGSRIANAAVLSTTLIMIAVNLCANIVKYNGKTTAEISDAIPVYFVPAGYVFAIWGLIYVGLLAYCLFQYQRHSTAAIVPPSVAFWIVVSNIANSVWLVLWHYEYIVQSVFLMLALLVSLIVVYRKLWAASKDVTGDAARQYYWLGRAPFSLYLGWISVATIANISGALSVWGWSGWGLAEITWATIMIAVAALLGIAMLALHSDYIFAAVIVWAATGIGMKFYETEMQYALFAFGCAAIVFLVMIFRGFLPRVRVMTRRAS